MLCSPIGGWLADQVLASIAASVFEPAYNAAVPTLALGAPLLAVAGVSGAFAVVGGGVVLATLVLARDATAPGAPGTQVTRVSRAHPGVSETLG